MSHQEKVLNIKLWLWWRRNSLFLFFPLFRIYAGLRGIDRQTHTFLLTGGTWRRKSFKKPHFFYGVGWATANALSFMSRQIWIFTELIYSSTYNNKDIVFVFFFVFRLLCRIVRHAYIYIYIYSLLELWRYSCAQL